MSEPGLMKRPIRCGWDGDSRGRGRGSSLLVAGSAAKLRAAGDKGGAGAADAPVLAPAATVGALGGAAPNAGEETATAKTIALHAA